MSTPPGDQPPYDPNQPYDPSSGAYGQPAPPPGAYGQPGAYGAPPPTPGLQTPATNGLAIGALITGILGVIGGLCCFLGIVSPVAIVLGVMGKKRADQSNGQMGGRGMALAGIILGAIGTLIFAAYIAFFIYAIATGGDVNYNYSTS